MPQHQLISLSGSPALTPAADPNLSVFVSESRIQATELRMNIAKIAEKMDVVLNKVGKLLIQVLHIFFEI